MWAVISKELQVVIRDRLGFIMLFVAPVVFITIMSLALGQVFGGLGKKTKDSYEIAIVDHDQSEQSEALIDTLKEIEEFIIITDYSQKKANTEIVSGKLSIAVVVPEGFGEDAKSTGKAELFIKLDPGQSGQVVVPTTNAVREVGSVVLATARAATLMAEAGATTTDTLTAQALVEATEEIQDIELTTTNQNADGLEDVAYPSVYQQNVPGYTIMFVFFIVTTLAGSITLERQQGTFRRLISSPLPRWKLLFGKVIPYTGISLVQIALLMAFGRFVFGMDLGPHPYALIPVSICLAICATALGVTLSAFAKTEAQTQGLGLIIILVLAAFGGCMVPLIFMPEWMSNAAIFTPHGLALKAFQDVMVRGLDVIDILPACGWLLAISAVLLAISLPRFLTLPNR